jgi:hypothetical protein
MLSAQATRAPSPSPAWTRPAGRQGRRGLPHPASLLLLRLHLLLLVLLLVLLLLRLLHVLLAPGRQARRPLDEVVQLHGQAAPVQVGAVEHLRAESERSGVSGAG